MGSANVSGIGAVMMPEQTAKSLTGSKEGDLKVGFMEMMSQMTLKTGSDTGSAEPDISGKKAGASDRVSGADSYDSNPYRRTEVKTAERAVEHDTLEEKTQTYEENVREVLKDRLGVTDEELDAVMELLGITVAGLADPNQLAALVSELTGCQDMGELLCSGVFPEVLTEVRELTEALLGELDMTAEEFQQACAVLQQEQPDAVEIPEMDADEVPLAKQPNEQADGHRTVLKQDEKTVIEADAETPEILTEHAEMPEEVKHTEKTVVTDETGQQQEQTDAQPETSVFGQETSQKQQSDMQGGGNHMAEQAAVVGQGNQQAHATAEIPEQTANFTRQMDTVDLIRQVADFARVTVRTAQTTMEMQLNPEHLGKIYLEVTSKAGSVSAHITAQNEAVKEVLESQIVELKQNMNQAGVKVDAVEVTVGNHEFERNLEQNGKQEERNAAEQEKTAAKTRKIDLNNLEELSGVMTEEESLVAQMMAEQGNSVDFTA